VPDHATPQEVAAFLEAEGVGLIDTTTDYRWEQYKVDLPFGESVGDVKIVPIEIDDETALISHIAAAFNNGRGKIWPGTYTGLMRGGDLWMSDSPDEISDHYPAIEMAETLGGRVLINGLGLGMVAKAALALPNVEHVDVVELDEDVIKLVGPHYECDRLTIHHADAFTIEWPSDARWDVVWHDIWLPISPDNLPEIARPKGKYAERAEWQGAWSEDLIYDRWPRHAPA